MGFVLENSQKVTGWISGYLNPKFIQGLEPSYWNPMEPEGLARPLGEPRALLSAILPETKLVWA